MGAGSVVWGLIGSVLCLAWTHMQVRFYARQDTPKRYLFLVGISWFLSVVAVAVLLPLDIALNNEVSGHGRDAMLVLWKLNYWTTFILCWVVCPVVQEYWAGGEFETKARWISAVRRNLKFYLYATAILAGVVVLVIVTNGFDVTQLSGFFIAAANCYGMLLVVIMLGYGLIELPREAYLKTNPKRLLIWYYCAAGQVESNLVDQQADLQQLVDEVQEFHPMNDSVVLDAYEKVKALAEEAVTRCLKDSATTRFQQQRRSRSLESLPSHDRDSALHHLASLQYKLKWQITQTDRAMYEWQNLLDITTRLEEKVELLEGTGGQDYQRLDEDTEVGGRSGNNADSSTSASRRGDDSANPSLIMADISTSSTGMNTQNQPLWLKRQLIFWKVFGTFLGCLSGLLLWNECVSPMSSKMSLFAVLVHESSSELLLLVSSTIPLVYMCACAYSALFKFKLLDTLALHGNRQTDVYCLLSNASYLGRLQFSLGINYVNMLRVSNAKNLAFSELVGDMRQVPFLGTSFNYYLPLVVVLLSLCTFFKVFDRFLRTIGIETHTDPSASFIDSESLARGQQLVSRTKSRQQRRQQRTESGNNEADASTNSGPRRHSFRSDH